MKDALLGLLAGFAAGAVMVHYGLCFNRAVREATFDGRPRLLRAFAFAVAAQLLLLPLLISAGVGTVERAAAGGGPALLPAANLVGGLAFGAGMALAGGCVTGMLWKAGEGQVALAIAIAGFAAGELLIRGPGKEVITRLDDASHPSEHALTGLLGVDYTPLALVVGVVVLLVLLRRGRSGVIAGTRARRRRGGRVGRRRPRRLRLRTRVRRRRRRHPRRAGERRLAAVPALARGRRARRAARSPGRDGCGCRTPLAPCAPPGRPADGRGRVDRARVQHRPRPDRACRCSRSGRCWRRRAWPWVRWSRGASCWRRGRTCAGARARWLVESASRPLTGQR